MAHLALIIVQTHQDPGDPDQFTGSEPSHHPEQVATLRLILIPLAHDRMQIREEYFCQVIGLTQAYDAILTNDLAGLI